MPVEVLGGMQGNASSRVSPGLGEGRDGWKCCVQGYSFGQVHLECFRDTEVERAGKQASSEGYLAPGLRVP